MLNKDGLIYKFKGNKGFTLIEVIASFAVLAIVSVTLLQMFVVSTKTNRITYDNDKANALCIEMSERFKADPDFAQGIPTFSTSPSAFGGGTVYTSYYNGDWSGESAAPATDSIYRLDVDITSNSAVTLSECYYPEPAWKGKIGNTGTETLSLNTTNSAICMAKLDLLQDYPVDTNKITQYTSESAIIPIQLECKDITFGTVRIDVNNTATVTKNGITYNAIADVYLCNVPTGTSITLNPVSGVIAENRISTKESYTVDYIATVSAIRLSDGLQLVKNTVQRHLVK